MSNSVRPHRQQPTRMPRPWDSPGKNTGVGCHFLLQCIKVKSESNVVQSCPTLSDPLDCSLPGSSIHGIFRQQYWSWVPLPSPGNLPDPEIKPKSLVWQADSLPLSHQRSPILTFTLVLCEALANDGFDESYGIFQATILRWVATSSSRF